MALRTQFDDGDDEVVRQATTWSRLGAAVTVTIATLVVVAGVVAVQAYRYNPVVVVGWSLNSYPKVAEPDHRFTLELTVDLLNEGKFPVTVTGFAPLSFSSDPHPLATAVYVSPRGSFDDATVFRHMTLTKGVQRSVSFMVQAPCRPLAPNQVERITTLGIDVRVLSLTHRQTIHFLAATPLLSVHGPQSCRAARG